MVNPVIRRARPDESHALSALTWRSKAHWGYDEAFLHAHRAGLTVTPEYIAEHPTYVMDQAGVPLGFHALELLDAGRVELGYLFVDPGHMGRGVGRALLDHAAETTLALGRTRMRIVSDPHAIGFYQKMGAVLWGEWRSPIVPGRCLPVLELDCLERIRGDSSALPRRPDAHDAGKGDQIGRRHHEEALVTSQGNGKERERVSERQGK